ncbi:MAG: SGNH/GDSL hydrolase family protein [Pseudobdellovibrio sp.]
MLKSIIAYIVFLFTFQIYAASDSWVSSWSSSMQPSTAPLELNNQSLSQTVHVSAGGKRWRVRLSNIFGESQVFIGVAHLTTATDSVLKFQGKTSFTIPSHGELVSDPVDVNVPAGTQLTVSLYFPQQTSLKSFHSVSLQKSYILTGDFSKSSDLSSSKFATSWYLLADVEVAAPEIKTIVTLGDSITDGVGSTMEANHRWPDFLASRLREVKAPFSIANQGIGFNRILDDQANANQPSISALKRFSHDVLEQAGVSYIILLEGINDIGLTAPDVDPVDYSKRLIVGYTQLIQQAHERHLKIFGATLTPTGGSGYGKFSRPQMRSTINDWIRTSGKFDAVIDFDAALRDPKDPEKMQSQYDSGDHLHPNDAGYEAMARAIDLTLFK